MHEGEGSWGRTHALLVVVGLWTVLDACIVELDEQLVLLGYG